MTGGKKLYRYFLWHVNPYKVVNFSHQAMDPYVLFTVLSPTRKSRRRGMVNIGGLMEPKTGT